MTQPPTPPTPPTPPSPPHRPAPSGAASNPAEEQPLNFIEQIVEADIASGKWGGRVHTRFPPEPNGYLHIGHAKSICLNYGLAAKHGGKFNLRFDDTNPTKEEQEYVDAIKADVKWLGADFENGTPHGGGLYFASDYFDRMFAFAEELIKKGKAYVCDLSGEEVSARRGKPGVPATSPFRDRPAEESLRLIREMKEGKHPDGSKSVRARIDLASPNFNLRDPVMYRILHEEHHNTGRAWCIYPMYDWAHGFEDSIEGITHSICTLEFEDHRPLYDWFIDAVNEGRTADGSGPWGKTIHHSQQIEFAKFRPTYTVLSKRNLLKMVQDGVVSAWDDPRMPTISGSRRRGYTPEAFRSLMEDVGVTKVESHIDVARLENAVRDDLNRRAPRRMAVLNPLRVIIENWPEGKIDMLDAVNNPEDPGAGARKVPFGREIFIERDDFMENPPKKFFRLAPGAEVRLRYAYFVTCTGVEKDAAGNITLVRCTHDPATRGGDAPHGPDGKPIRRVQGTIHWVSAEHAIKAEVRLFDRLFTAEHPGDRTGNAMDDLNPQSLTVVKGALLEPSLGSRGRDEPEWADGIRRFQFERLGYFCIDRDSAASSLVFNRTVTLKDTWAKVAGKGG
ncbi:MAG: glutamine--tRNA ligase/YqeY domain fusion protein [Phycisphaeraceae bacterium]|nr:glutamine--tRNA ligase/YqeY domain fusion protein [Phycisphaeraceae bacterium]